MWGTADFWGIAPRGGPYRKPTGNECFGGPGTADERRVTRRVEPATVAVWWEDEAVGLVGKEAGVEPEFMEVREMEHK